MHMHFLFESFYVQPKPHILRWRNNERDGVSNHRRLDCLLNCFFRCRSKTTSKLRVTGVCGGNPSVTGGFLSQRASNAENVSIWWRHHDKRRIYKHRKETHMINMAWQVCRKWVNSDKQEQYINNSVVIHGQKAHITLLVEQRLYEATSSLG